MRPSPLDNYEDKRPAYFENERPELLPLVPADAARVLDVGCGAGRFGARLRQQQRCEVWGVEPDGRAAELARGRLDRVIAAPFAPGLDLPEGGFDLVCFNDVLEHLATPEKALDYARQLLAPGGRVLASVPNFRHFNNLWELVVRGEARYRQSGVMDRTHLRIFTQRSLRQLFTDSGFGIQYLGGITPQFTRRLFHVFNLLSLGTLRDTRWLQLVVLAQVGDRGRRTS